jgi:hypothetical protein
MPADRLQNALIYDKRDNHIGDELHDNWGAQL